MDSVAQIHGRPLRSSSSSLHSATSGSGPYSDGSVSTAVDSALTESLESTPHLSCAVDVTRAEFERRCDVGAAQRWTKHRQLADATPHAQCDTCHWTKALHVQPHSDMAAAAVPVLAATATPPTCSYETALDNVLCALGNELDVSQSAHSPLQLDIRMTFAPATGNEGGGGQLVPVLHGTVSRWKDGRMRMDAYGRPQAAMVDMCAPFYDTPWRECGGRQLQLYGAPASVDVSLPASCCACYSASRSRSRSQSVGESVRSQPSEHSAHCAHFHPIGSVSPDQRTERLRTSGKCVVHGAPSDQSLPATVDELSTALRASDGAAAVAAAAARHRRSDYDSSTSTSSSKGRADRAGRRHSSQ